MRVLVLAALLAFGCSAPPPAGVQGPAAPPRPVQAPPAAPPATAAFDGHWRVVAISGAYARPGQSPILIRVGPELVHARADCANLGEPGYAVRGDRLLIQPPPPGIICSCARGLSDYEAAFREVFRPGAVGRLQGGRLVLEYSGRAVEAVRDPAPQSR